LNNGVNVGEHLMATKIDSKVDLRGVQEQVEESAKSVRAYSRKAELIALGMVGMAYDKSVALMGASRKFIATVERRGAKVEQSIGSRIQALRDEAGAEVHKVRTAIEQRMENITEGVSERADAVERQVQGTLDKVRRESGNGWGLEAATVTIEVEKAFEKMDSLPFPDYDDLTVDQVTAKLAELDAESLATMRNYEAAHKQRVTVLRELDAALQARTAEAA
jgi:hypothetical protein